MKIDLYKDAESFAQSKRFTDWKKEFVKTDLYKKLENKYVLLFFAICCCFLLFFTILCYFFVFFAQ